MKLLYILTLIPALALASNEAQVGCELVKAQAELQATELADPSLFGMVGQPTELSNTIAVGVTESLSGLIRAHDIRKSSNAKCDAIYAETNLDLYQKWAILSAQRKGDLAEQNKLDETVNLQKDYISNLHAQLIDQVVTVTTLEAADATYINIEQRQEFIAKNLAMEIIPPPDGDLNDLIKEANIKEGTSAMLSAKSTANGGWDFALSIGARRLLNGDGATSGFITAQAKYSFGTSAAQKAAKLVGEKTQELLDIQNAGYNQTVQRNRIELLRLVDIERQTVVALSREEGRIEMLRQPLIGIDSTLAKNAITEANIQISIVQASIAGSKARLEAYQVLLNRFTLIK